MTEKANMNPKKRGLGRGLGALFEDEESPYPQAGGETQPSGVQRKLLGIEQIEPGTFQPRTVFDDDALGDLAESIRTYGVLQPILVRPHPKDANRFEVVAGERRWRAAQLAQLHEVPVVIRALEDSEAMHIALIENLQREDLNPIEEARAYQRLIDEFSANPESIGQGVGKSRSHIANTLRLLNLPNNVQDMVLTGTLSAGHARALIGADDPMMLAREVINKGLSVRATEKLVADAKGREIKHRGISSAKAKSGKDVDTLALESEVSNVLGMRVAIDMKDQHAGSLSIEFRSLDQLDEVLHRLTHYPGRPVAG